MDFTQQLVGNIKERKCRHLRSNVLYKVEKQAKKLSCNQMNSSLYTEHRILFTIHLDFYWGTNLRIPFYILTISSLHLGYLSTVREVSEHVLESLSSLVQSSLGTNNFWSLTKPNDNK